MCVVAAGVYAIVLLAWLCACVRACCGINGQMFCGAPKQLAAAKSPRTWPLEKARMRAFSTSDSWPWPSSQTYSSSSGSTSSLRGVCV